jgi:hypothetical protein
MEAEPVFLFLTPPQASLSQISKAITGTESCLLNTGPDALGVVLLFLVLLHIPKEPQISLLLLFLGTNQRVSAHIEPIIVCSLLEVVNTEIPRLAQEVDMNHCRNKKRM